MIYKHQQDAIDFITAKMQQDEQVEALLISGSIAHGFNDEQSDVDFNVVVSNEIYEKKRREHALTYYESAETFYPGGYFDGKYISLDYLSLVAQKGNEPSRFALHDSMIAFDRTNQVAASIAEIGRYNLEGIQEKTTRFLSQIDAWKWFCGEAIRKKDAYLLDVSVSKLILFAGRLILLDNRKFFPYHKWFLRVLDSCINKPSGMLQTIRSLIEQKTEGNITALYQLVKEHKDWAAGEAYSWSSNFVFDIETVWMRHEDCIENI